MDNPNIIPGPFIAGEALGGGTVVMQDPQIAPVPGDPVVICRYKTDRGGPMLGVVDRDVERGERIEHLVPTLREWQSPGGS